MSVKFCTKCKQDKAADSFYLDASRKDGMRPHCKACILSRTRAFRQANQAQTLATNRAYREANREWLYDRAARQRHQMRAELIHSFGGCCASCGYSDERALQFDHREGGGAKDRKENTDWWAYLKKIMAMPEAERVEKYQLLCANCNQIKRVTNSEYGDGKKSRRESARNCSCTKGSRGHCPVHAPDGQGMP